MPRKKRTTKKGTHPPGKRSRTAKTVPSNGDSASSGPPRTLHECKSDRPSHEVEIPRTTDEEVGVGRSYFESHKGVVKTTNLTLADLSVAPAARLEAALADLEEPFELEQERLENQIRNRFDQFVFMLAADHSLLFYGYGSKRTLLEHLAEYLQSSHSVLIVNGFNPTVNLRAIFSQIATDILCLTDFPKRTLLDYVDAIRSGIKRDNIAIVIHNIDGPPFRAAEAQHALSTLAKIHGISIVASVDHVNAPLLWDGAIYSRYDWAWIKADTFKSYRAETVFCSKPLLRGGKERRIEGAVALLKSLSERACNIFRELAKKQTGYDKSMAQSASTRLSFNQLFEIAKANFLASDPATLRIILTELETHDLLQRRRGADMTEQLWIPLEPSQLEQVLNQID